MAAWTVLVADDEADTRGLVRASLEDLGYEIFEAADGDEAWELLLRERPDLAILDVAMPGRNGMELAAAMAAEPMLQATRVVLLTGVDPLDLHQQSPSEGSAARIDLFVQKPFTPSALRQALAAELLR